MVNNGSNGQNCSKMVQKGPLGSIMVRIGPQWSTILKMVLHGQILPKMVKNFQNGLNDQKWSKVIQNGPLWFKLPKLLQNCSKLSKMVQVIHNGQNGPKFSK